MLELVCIFLIGAALTYTFGRFVRNQRQGWALFAAMSVLFVAGFTARTAAEAAGNPIVHALGVAGGNMEGKETRFGIAASALFATMTTDTSCGAVNAMHDSFTPLGGLVPLLNMQLGEIVFGGVGTGFYGIIYFVVLTVFIAGLMVGRTPEYLGKKIERREVQLAILAVLVVPVFALDPGRHRVGAAGRDGDARTTAGRTDSPRCSTLTRRGRTTTAARSRGLGGNTFFNVSGGIVMLFGRFAIIDAGARARRLARRQAQAFPRPPARSPRPRRSSSCC